MRKEDLVKAAESGNREAILAADDKYRSAFDDWYDIRYQGGLV